MPDDLVLVDSSACGCDEAARRLKACSQISVLAFLTEPSWRVVVDAFEQRVEVTIGDRSYGDTDCGDEDVMVLYVRTPSTVYRMGESLMEASARVEPIVAGHSQHVPNGSGPGAAEQGESGQNAQGRDVQAALGSGVAAVVPDGPVSGGA